MARPPDIAMFVAALRELGLARISESDVACSTATIDDLVDSWGIPDDARSGGGVLVFIWRDLATDPSSQDDRNARYACPLDEGCLVFATVQGSISVN